MRNKRKREVLSSESSEEAVQATLYTLPESPVEHIAQVVKITTITGEPEIVVKSLLYSATEQDIEDLFTVYGEVKSLKLLRTPQGDSKGLAFLKFSTEKAALDALELDGSEFLGRKLTVKLAKTEATANPGVTTVFVGDIPYESTEDELASLFEASGEVREIRISRDKQGRKRGYAHVDFHTFEDTDKAVKLNGTSVAGRKIRVDYANEIKFEKPVSVDRSRRTIFP